MPAEKAERDPFSGFPCFHLPAHAGVTAPFELLQFRPARVFFLAGPPQNVCPRTFFNFGGQRPNGAGTPDLLAPIRPSTAALFQVNPEAEAPPGMSAV